MPEIRDSAEERVAKAVRIPRTLNEQLEQIAGERQVSINLVVTWALEDYVARARPIEELRSAS